jgi:hypothetical protein
VIGELLASYVELGLPATSKQIEQLVSLAGPPEKQALERITDDAPIPSQS